jgi:TPR repeat protein
MKQVHISCFVLILLVLSAVCFADNLDEALKAANVGDYAKAYQLMLLDAEQGNAIAQTNVGLMCNDGLGVPQDEKKAVWWYRLAADQGYPRAQYYLGTMFEEGHGVPQDYKEAAKSYRLAAIQGYVKAQFKLGLMYLRGQGVMQSNESAYAWWSVAATNGHEEALKYRASAEEQMTPQQIAAAQQIAKQIWTEIGH